MSDPYQEHIEKCKQPKSWSKVHRILQYLILGVRNKYSTSLMVEKLNARGVKPLVSDKWTVNSLGMQLMFLARLDESSSLGRGFRYMMQEGLATDNDLFLLRERTRN